MTFDPADLRYPFNRCHAPKGAQCSWVCDLGNCQYEPPKMKPFDIVRGFEQAVCDYTGAPYCVAVNSCTMALLLAVKWHILGAPLPPEISIPKRTYVSVPMSIIHAGGWPVFRDEDWLGAYQLAPLNVWDSARLFTGGMFSDFGGDPGSRFVCVSFHTTKVLGDTQGGAILHDNPEADAWLRRMRFDGRTEGVAPKDDTFREIAFHCYMSPDVAARLLHKLSVLPAYNPPLPNDAYPDLSQLDVFK